MSPKRQRESRPAGIIERLLRGLMIVFGATGFGLGAGALGVYGLLTITLGPIKPDGWGAIPAWLFMMAVGGIIGLITGILMSISRIRSHEFEAYRALDWLGLLAGTAAGIGLTLLASEPYYFFMKGIIAASIIPPCTVVGRWLFGALPGLIRTGRYKP